MAEAEPTDLSPKRFDGDWWLSSELISAIIGALVGALIGSGMSKYFATRHARKQMKLETLRRFVANRFHLTGPEFSQVLNEILIIFADSSQVTTALNDFAKDRTNPKLVALYRAMCKDSGLKDKMFQMNYSLRPSISRINESRSLVTYSSRACSLIFESFRLRITTQHILPNSAPQTLKSISSLECSPEQMAKLRQSFSSDDGTEFAVIATVASVESPGASENGPGETQFIAKGRCLDFLVVNY